MRKLKVLHMPGTPAQIMRDSIARRPKKVIVMEISQTGEGTITWSRQTFTDLITAEWHFRAAVDAAVAGKFETE